MSMKASTFVSKLAAAAGVLFLLSGCSLLPKEEEALKPPLVKPVKENFELYEVKKGSITKTLSAVGTFVSSQTTNLSFSQSGQRLASFDVSLGDEVKAGDVVAQLDAGDLATRIQIQKLELEKAQIASIQTLQDDPNNTQAIRLKKIDIEAAQIQLQSLQEQLDKTKLIAPKPGIVTYKSDAKQGDEIEAYDTLVTISDPSRVQLVYEASDASSLTSVQVGMDVDIELGETKTKLKGTVLQTPSSAPATDNKEQAERNAKTLYIGVPQGIEGTQIGSYGDFTIVIEKRDDVLVIPRTGLRSYLGRDYVQVLDGESRKEIDVEKGLVTQTEVEIRRGLTEGQKVILNN